MHTQKRYIDRDTPTHEEGSIKDSRSNSIPNRQLPGKVTEKSCEQSSHLPLEEARAHALITVCNLQKVCDIVMRATKGKCGA